METRSVHGVPIRLSGERWEHIASEHSEIANLRDEVLRTLATPVRVLAGNGGELLAIDEYLPGKFLVVVYREEELDGFVITAFFTRRSASLGRRRRVWPT
ncbi:MAG: hypothetical protein ACKVT1_12765 [Dehalococcoidia bacterium]